MEAPRPEHRLEERPAHQRLWVDLLDFVREWQPPLDRREFWAIQALVLMIAGGHFALEAMAGELHASLTFLPASLFLIPVVYAALNFGLHGSLPTALWCALLTVPNAVLFHTDVERLGEVWQIGVVIALAVFVGQRVDHEKRARQQAEERDQARRASEQKYRAIFDHVAEPILLLDGQGVVEAANEAAGRLLGAPAERLTGRHMRELIELDPVALTGAEAGAVRRVTTGRGDRTVWIEPVLIPLADGEAQGRSQLMLRDLTPQYERQQELEAYARRTTAAREEERARIARELHDGPVQTLVLLWRRLDALGPMADEAQEAELRAAQGAARDAADELRRVSRDLRPSILHDLGLTPALRAEVSSFARRSGVVARIVSVGSERRLSADRELALLRIAQEALRNVEQHAQARRATVRLQFEPLRIRLSIADNGRGIVDRPLSELAAAGKLGLIGMKEQARLIDGTLTIGSGRRGGTVITVTVAG